MAEQQTTITGKSKKMKAKLRNFRKRVSIQPPGPGRFDVSAKTSSRAILRPVPLNFETPLDEDSPTPHCSYRINERKR
jgi:hypothetical protein